jgi:hypothetical protein
MLWPAKSVAAATAVDTRTRGDIDAARAKIRRLESEREQAMLDAMRAYRAVAPIAA